LNGGDDKLHYLFAWPAAIATPPLTTPMMLGAKSLSEFVELSGAHARKQLEAMTAQTKELTELAQKVTTEIAANDWRHGDSKASSKVA
jgi:hypothetical protein